MSDVDHTAPTRAAFGQRLDRDDAYLARLRAERLGPLERRRAHVHAQEARARRRNGPARTVDTPDLGEAS